MKRRRNGIHRLSAITSFLFRRFFEVQWAYIFGMLSSAKERRWEGMPIPVWMAIIAAGNMILDAIDNDDDDDMKRR